MTSSKEKREEFLETAYEISGGSKRAFMNSENIASNSNLSLDETRELLHTLTDFGDIEGKSLGGDFGITAQGIRKAEELKESSRQPKSSENSNQIHIGKVEGDFNGQIQQEGKENSQTANFGDVDYRKIEQEILPEMKDLIRSPTYQTGEDFKYYTEIVEEEVNSDSPDQGKLKDALTSAKKILENATATGIASQIPKLIEKIELVL
jgi:hypothetical protein